MNPVDIVRLYSIHLLFFKLHVDHDLLYRSDIIALGADAPKHCL